MLKARWRDFKFKPLIVNRPEIGVLFIYFPFSPALVGTVVTGVGITS